MSKKSLYGNAPDELNHRRQWNKEKYQKEAQLRDEILREREESKDPKSSKKINPVDVKPEQKFMQAREDQVDLESNLNKSVLVNLASGKQPGFYCEVCDCVLKDSVNYLDHLNGQQHHLKLGVTMRTVRSSVSDVKARLEKLKRRNDDPEDIDVKTRLERARELMKKEEEEKKEKKKEKKRLKKEQQKASQQEFVDEDVASIMGFGGFANGGKNTK
ncbi:zinc finger, matrin-type 2 [Nowakowskiella sp. JEL0407]|nr:zinc finger, matrin-type 2 [Nowakowskiella sp. JEL0407]